MNKVRRKELEVIRTKIEELHDFLESIKEDEEEAMENMPENLWGSDRYYSMEEAVEYMQYAMDNLQDAMGNIECACE